MSDTDPTETEANDKSERRSRFSEIASKLNQSDSNAENDSSGNSNTSADETEQASKSGLHGSTESDKLLDPHRDTEAGSNTTGDDGPDDLDSWMWVDDESDRIDEIQTDRTVGDRETKASPKASSTNESGPVTDEPGTDPAGDAESVDESTTGVDGSDRSRHDDETTDSYSELDPTNDFSPDGVEVTDELGANDETIKKTGPSPTMTNRLVRTTRTKTTPVNRIHHKQALPRESSESGAVTLQRTLTTGQSISRMTSQVSLT